MPGRSESHPETQSSHLLSQMSSTVLQRPEHQRKGRGQDRVTVGATRKTNVCLRRVDTHTHHRCPCGVWMLASFRQLETYTQKQTKICRKSPLWCFTWDRSWRQVLQGEAEAKTSMVGPEMAQYAKGLLCKPEGLGLDPQQCTGCRDAGGTCSQCQQWEKETGLRGQQIKPTSEFQVQFYRKNLVIPRSRL